MLQSRHNVLGAIIDGEKQRTLMAFIHPTTDYSHADYIVHFIFIIFNRQSKDFSDIAINEVEEQDKDGILPHGYSPTLSVFYIPSSPSPLSPGIRNRVRVPAFSHSIQQALFRHLNPSLHFSYRH